MDTNQQLLDEILDSASKIPLECQERIRDVVKAMAFVHKVMKREGNAFQNGGSA